MVKQMPGNRVVLISLLQLRKSTLYPGPDSFPEYTGYGGCMEEPKLIKVVGAAIIKDGKVLCAQRGAGKSLAGYWEFPGGKIEAGETPQQALQREIEEELLCEIDIDKKVCTSDYLYDFGNVQLTTFLCHLIEGMPRLTDHECIEWVEPSQMPRLRWAPVDHDAVTRISGMAF